MNRYLAPVVKKENNQADLGAQLQKLVHVFLISRNRVYAERNAECTILFKF